MAGRQIKYVSGAIGNISPENGTFSPVVLLNSLFIHLLLTRLLVLATKILAIKMNWAYKILLVFSYYLAAYSDFFHESILCKSWNSDCDCDMYGSHIMLAGFCQQHEAAVEEILEPSITSRYCYCKNFCIYEKICRNIWM